MEFLIHLFTGMNAMTRLPPLLALLLVLSLTGPAAVRAQTAPGSLGPGVEPPRLHLGGPRFGVTAFTGDVATARRSLDKSAFMTQFGWQLETQILATSAGHQALLEWVFLLGGVEQGETNLSGALLAGYRLPNGVEFGAGPNVSFSSESSSTTSSMLLAAGVTLPMGELRVPLNLAMALAEGGPRLTFLVGWVVGR